MTHPLPEQPTELKIDVEQWRRDIQTFVETTNRALDAIAGELSNSCSSSFDEPSTKSHGNKGYELLTKAHNEPAFTAGVESSGDDRLARLKAQLAARISKTN